MLLKQIAALCKSNKHLVLIDEARNQYISVGDAIYRLSGLPELDTPTLCNMFDITEKQQSKMHIDHTRASDLPFSIGYKNESELIMAQTTSIILKWADEEYEVIVTTKGVRLIKCKNLRPLKELMKDEYVRYTERVTTDGSVIICVKIGFFDEAYLRTFQLNSEMKEDITLLDQVIHECDEEPDNQSVPAEEESDNDAD